MKTTIQVHKHFENLRDFIAQIPERFDKCGTTVFEKRNVVKRITTPDGKALVVKRYKLPNFFQRLGYSTFRKSKARRAYEYGLEFQRRGIDTPQPVAYIEQWKGPIFHRGFYICEECHDTSCTVLRNNDYPERDELIKAFAAFLRRMHKRGILHGDTNLSNFFFRKKTEEEISKAREKDIYKQHQRSDSDVAYHFTAIDLNRTKFVQHPSHEQCLKNLVRVTHDDLLMVDIVSAYARRRGWKEWNAVNYVQKKLKQFETRNKIKDFFKFKKKKKDEKTHHHHHHHHHHEEQKEQAD